ncbi:MAG: hypothetical protein J5680_06435, partial [Neisseriaceae bacterium]|nr:hypothetical protein [Neisseriaceae bacterium]
QFIWVAYPKNDIAQSHSGCLKSFCIASVFRIGYPESIFNFALSGSFKNTFRVAYPKNGRNTK